MDYSAMKKMAREAQTKSEKQKIIDQIGRQRFKDRNDKLNSED